jgi:hypothetical protein
MITWRDFGFPRSWTGMRLITVFMAEADSGKIREKP